MNPYIIVAIMIVIDIVSLPFIVRSMLKKDIRKKGIVITAFLAVFIAVEIAFSVFYINSNQFYDREGNIYTSQEEVLYYDREGNEYTLNQTKVDRWHFISTDGRRMHTAERVYVDEEGYIFFDAKNELIKTELEYAYTDGEGNKYFRADEIKWDHKGELTVRDKG
ncbi:MAG: hypothetical protein IKJ69_06425 [Clostridia bacterium]|nr:hypothetical protein [Clostridia bacterium]